MTVRRLTEADEPTASELWHAFAAELFAGSVPTGAWERARRSLHEALKTGAAYLATDEQGATGIAWAGAPHEGVSQLFAVYVEPRVRRQGIAKELVHACLEELGEHGASFITLELPAANPVAQAVSHGIGFADVTHVLGAPLEMLRSRVEVVPERVWRAAVHVQTDDRTSVERAINQFVPRLTDPHTGAEANGWIRVSDEELDRDPDAQGRLATELSDRLGTVSLALAIEDGAVVRFRLYERGRMVDEYLSLPTYYGPLAKVDELALEANPTLVARLTGASFADVRRVARTGRSSTDLPAPEDLYEQIAELMGVES